MRSTAPSIAAGPRSARPWRIGRPVSSCGWWSPDKRPTATWPWTSCGPPRRPPWPPAAGWAGATSWGRDGAAVKAMRTVLSSVPMDGIVVIGEGEKDNAPMLFNGEQIGDGSRSADRHRGRPDRRHHADRAGPRRGPRRHRRGRAGGHVRPGAVRLHGEDGRGPAGQGCLRHPGHAHREPPRALEGLGSSRPRPDRGHPRPPPPRGPHRRGPRHRRPHPPHHRRRRGGRHRHGMARGGRRHPLRHRWHPEGVLAAAALKCMGGEIQGRLCPRDDEERAGAHWRPGTTSTPC